jgi:mannosyltransferase
VPASTRWPAWLTTGLMTGLPAIVALAMGGYRLGTAPLWRDEAATKAVAGRSFGQILATLPHDDVVHGGYYLVIHVVIDVLGASAAALRLPSLVAMAVACAFTALIARDLTAASGAPLAALTGFVAGIVFAVTPSTVRFAQEARSYAIVTALAAIATYLLLIAIRRGGRWWLAYGVALALTGLFNLFGVLIVLPHCLVVLAGSRDAPHAVRARWAVTAAGATVVLVPVGVLAYAQRGALSWLSSRPSWWPDFVTFIQGGVASWRLAIPLFGLVALGIAAELMATRGRLRTGPSAVALPWLFLPTVLLLTVSLVRAMWGGERYVEFCLPAFAILIASGFNALARLVARTPFGRQGLAWIPLAVAPILILGAFSPDEGPARSARPDNLLAESAIIARYARAGDAIIYLPINDRIVSLPYPGPFMKLRDIALAGSPAASDTLYGTDVSPAELAQRWTGVTRVWVVTSSEVSYFQTDRATALDNAEGRLISRMHVVGQWRDGDTELILYA